MNEDQLDRLIDTAAVELVSGEPAHSLRRVVASRAASDDAVPHRHRTLAWTATAAAVCVLVFFAVIWSRTPASPPIPIANRTESPTLPAQPVDRQEPREPQQHASARAPRPAVTVRPSNTGVDDPSGGFAIAPTPLDVPPIEVSAIPLDQITVEPLVIQPLDASD